METKTKKTCPQDLKKQRDSPSRRSLREILQQGLEAQLQPANLLLRFKPKAGMNQW
jgi:hypothetical protein